MLVATVPDGLPHVYDLDGRYLGRSGVQNRSLVADALKRLLIERGQISYETLPVRGGAYADLDVEKVSRYLALVRAKLTGTPEEILRDRGCVVQKDGVWTPTNAGMLLFGKIPPRNSDITLVRYAGRGPSDQFLRKDINLTLPEAVQDAQMWLLANMRKGSKLEGSGREDFTEYPGRGRARGYRQRRRPSRLFDRRRRHSHHHVRRPHRVLQPRPPARPCHRAEHHGRALLAQPHHGAGAGSIWA